MLNKELLLHKNKSNDTFKFIVGAPNTKLIEFGFNTKDNFGTIITGQDLLLSKNKTWKIYYCRVYSNILSETGFITSIFLDPVGSSTTPIPAFYINDVLCQPEQKNTGWHSWTDYFDMYNKVGKEVSFKLRWA